MVAATAQSLSALLRRSTIEDHDEVLRACNNALKLSKTDIEAQQVKVVALLKLDRYEDALRVFEDGGEKLKDRLPLERAYALYKQGKYDEAEKITQLARGGRGLRHVEAQTVRGCGSSSACVSVLTDVHHRATGWRTSHGRQRYTKSYMLVQRLSRMKRTT